MARMYRRSRRSAKRRGVTKRSVALITKRVINRQQELKWKQVTAYGSNPNPNLAAPVGAPAVWQFYSVIQGIQQGNQVGDREGDRIFIKYIDYYIRLIPVNASSMANGGRCRVLLYRNRLANGLAPVALQVFDSDQIDTMRNVQKIRTIGLSRDYIHQFVATSGDGTNVFTSGPEANFIWRQKVNKQITYQDNSGTVSALLQDDFGFGLIADENCCAVLCKAKVFFHE